MKLTPEQQAAYDKAKHCHICDEEIIFKDNKVRDHCHLTGKFRGAAHNHCNLHYQVPKFIPVYFHNLATYDAHLFIKKLGLTQDHTIKLIPNNEEKYISFSKIISIPYEELVVEEDGELYIKK